MKRKLAKVEKFLLLAMLLAASFYFYLNRVYDPKFRDFKEVREVISAMEQEIVSFGVTPGTTSLEAKVEEERMEIKVLENELHQLQKLKKASDDAAVARILAEVNRLAFKNNLILKNQGFVQHEGAPTDPGVAHFSWQEYDLVFEGGHPNLAKFIGDLQKMRPFIVIGNLEMRDPGRTGRFEIRLKLYI